jgi:ankyrin repeat protein
MKCGPDEVDGFALCSGLSALNLSYTTHPDLQGLIPPMTYLIQDAIFRPRHGRSQPETSQPGTFSLNIHPLGELMDMYRARKATNRLDRIYALLGMSSDDPRAAGLSVDYNLPWGRVFEKFTQFLLSDQVSVDTWDDCAVAVIQGKGHIWGGVYEVGLDDTRGDVQHIYIAWKDARGHFGQSLQETSRHILRASAQPIRAGDAVCFLQGASKPTIVRFQKAYSQIIMITAPLEETLEEMDQETCVKADEKWSRLLSYIPTSLTDFVMIWDWDAPQHDSHERGYESFISSRGPPRPWTESQDHFVKATRWWNFGLLLNSFELYKDAWVYFQDAVDAYVTALTNTATSPGYSAWTVADKEARMAMNDLVIGDKSALAEAESFNDDTAPLFWAVEKGHESLVKVLLDKGAPCEVDPSTEFTPLFCAMEKGHERIMQLLLDKGAILHTQTSDHRSRLEWAAEQGHVGIVKWLLLNNGDDYLNSDGIHCHANEALSAAAQAGHDKIVQILFENCPGVDGFGSYDGNPLHVAALGGHDKVVQILLERGADVNAGARRFRYVHHAAAFGGHDKTVQILLGGGARVDKFGASDGNPLQVAALGGHDKVVQMLLEKGADVNAKAGSFGSALQAASYEGHKKTVQILLEKGADVNAQGGLCGSALQAASLQAHEEIVQILLEAGANRLDE